MTPSDHTEETRGLRARFGRSSVRTRSVLAATGLLVVGLSTTGVAATNDTLREGVRNGTATKETQIVANIRETGQATGGYSTRQSNLSTSGGGAIYGCRSRTGAGNNPCFRGNNLSTGRAFEFNASDGNETGRITAGNGGDSKRPFSTNATGVATGLNADRVDGANASDIVTAARVKTGLDADTLDGANASDLYTRWALVNESGKIEQQTGGFTLVNCYQANANCYIDTGAPASNKGVWAETSVANTDGSSIFSGETGTAPCALSTVACAPAGAEAPNVVVVAPRKSDGSSYGTGTAAPTAAEAARFYVFVSGSTGGPTGTPPTPGTSGTGSTGSTGSTGATGATSK